jgi:chorismate mutase
MDLKDLRSQIDSIDDELVHLFGARMEIAAQIADYKKQNGLPILVPAREREKLQDVAKKAGPEMADYVCRLYATIFELSREHQSKQNHR